MGILPSLVEVSFWKYIFLVYWFLVLFCLSELTCLLSFCVLVSILKSFVTFWFSECQLLRLSGLVWRKKLWSYENNIWKYLCCWNVILGLYRVLIGCFVSWRQSNPKPKLSCKGTIEIKWFVYKAISFEHFWVIWIYSKRTNFFLIVISF